ncbi:hypothetical protein DPMN_141997 [Dreissena polymorpha]|uniref:Uncharacterized protein n=1 Tax=Dreissena polymorpha TaxID=45954 RepID=A0A9D4GDP3_DREPO|nr:hypothetical protein DPMN_141997 [Dreissena polymorpha]
MFLVINVVRIKKIIVVIFAVISVVNAAILVPLYSNIVVIRTGVIFVNFSPSKAITVKVLVAVITITSVDVT